MPQHNLLLLSALLAQAPPDPEVYEVHVDDTAYLLVLSFARSQSFKKYGIPRILAAHKQTVPRAPRTRPVGTLVHFHNAFWPYSRFGIESRL